MVRAAWGPGCVRAWDAGAGCRGSGPQCCTCARPVCPLSTAPARAPAPRLTPRPPPQAQVNLGPDFSFVPAAARSRHAVGGPRLFAGQRLQLLVAPSHKRGPYLAAMRQQTEQMVRAEGGAVAHGGAADGRASPSPSPEGATLLVCVGQTREEMTAGLKAAKVARGWRRRGRGPAGVSELRCLHVGGRRLGLGSGRTGRGWLQLHMRPAPALLPRPAESPPRIAHLLAEAVPGAPGAPRELGVPQRAARAAAGPRRLPGQRGAAAAGRGGAARPRQPQPDHAQPGVRPRCPALPRTTCTLLTALLVL